MVVNLENRKKQKKISLFLNLSLSNEVSEDTKIRKDLTAEKFKSEIKPLQTQTERYKQRIFKT